MPQTLFKNSELQGITQKSSKTGDLCGLNLDII
jgi:hypothetical protein